MNAPCDDYRDKLAELISAGLPDQDHEAIENHLSECRACREYQRALLADHRLVSSLVGSMDERVEGLEDRVVDAIRQAEGAEPVATDPASLARRSAAPQSGSEPAPQVDGVAPQVWWSQRWFRYAALAAAALVIVAGLQLLRGPGPLLTPMAWAEVIAQVEAAESFICRWRMESNMLDDGPIEAVRYQSPDGTRDDQYQRGRLMTRTYWVPSALEEIALHMYDEAYLVTHHTKEEFDHRSMQGDAQGMVEFFRSYPYRELGTRRIDGIRAAGIELEDPEFILGAFDSARYRLWVDPATNWPVRLDVTYRADAGRLRIDIEFYDFQWNPVLPASEVEPEIPDGFQLAMELDAPVADEEHAIRGLRGLADLTRGRYPSSLTWGSAAGQAIRDIRRDGAGRNRVQAVEQLMSIRSAIAFYVELDNGGRDVAYYGDRVTPRDFDRVLMRWRLEDGSYRVIYGDLRVETVSPERLEELEGGGSQ